MAQVLRPPQTGSPFGSRPLSRNASKDSVSRRKADVVAPVDASTPIAATLDDKSAVSIHYSASSSPQLAAHYSSSSSQASLQSTPSSSLSLDDEYNNSDDDGITFPSYHAETSTKSSTSDRPAPKRMSTARRKPKATPNMSEMPDVPLKPNPSFISMGDDAAIKREPARHVDYLSHNWREEDIWNSWRYIVAARRSMINAERLENASWRTWAKTQGRLKTVSPATLNWMKDHDVTWLYGPLQTIDPNTVNPDSPAARSHLSRTDSFVLKKPILKRRNVSEAMLQRSLSNSTLVLQAVQSIALQEKKSAFSINSSRFHEHVSTPAPSPHEYDYFSSSHSECTSTSLDPTTPGTEKRHITFNNKVEQCIAVDKDLDDADAVGNAIYDDDDESSDDGIVMMATSNGKERKLSSAKGTPRGSFSSDTQAKTTIAMLPSTTLKYRGDTPEPPERANTPKPSMFGWGRKLNHSASSETLKPARPSNNFLIDDDEEEDPGTSWQSSSYSAGGIPIDYYDEDDEELEARGMRRTPSGMFMPCDDDEEGGPEGSGIFGRVVDTVNTARDIAHVIWNVGWRR